MARQKQRATASFHPRFVVEKAMIKKLGDFLGQHSSPSTYRGPKRMKSTLGKAEVFDFIALIRRWPEIVGSVLARESLPLKNRGGVLTVLTREPAFSEQIKFMEEPIKKKIFQTFPSLEGKISRINFFCNPTAFAEQRQHYSNDPQVRTQKATPSLHPQSPLYRKLLQEAKQELGEFQDEELEQAFQSLYIQLKSPRQGNEP
jgi:hypothetical protein